MKPQLLFALVMSASLSQFASAACKLPNEPELPNVDSAVLAEMVKAAKDVKAYLADANKYLDCARNDSSHDKVVERMRVIADEFNELTTTFKARRKTAVASN